MIFTARIESEGKYSHLDAQGRYNLRNLRLMKGIVLCFINTARKAATNFVKFVILICNYKTCQKFNQETLW